MTLRNLLLSTITAAILAGTPAAHAAIGVGVGNGQRAYWNPGAKFAVAYNDTLSLEVNGADRFQISNEKLVRGEEPVSKITFTTLKGAVKDQAELSEYVRGKYPERAFTALKVPGAEGLGSESRSGDHLDGLYFLLTTNGDLVKVIVDAYSVGNGINFVAPILRSFTYDVTAPVIDGVEIREHEWPAGSMQHVYVHTTDENSGVNAAGLVVMMAESPTRDKIRQVPIKVIGAKPRGDGWYRLDLRVSEFQKPGQYCAQMVESSDRAGNFLRLLQTAHEGKRYAKSFGSDGVQNELTNVSVPCARITNSGKVDVTPPRLLEIRPDPTPWPAGTSRRIYFRVQDDVSGVDVNKLTCGQLYAPGVQRQELRCHDPRAEGGDWYSVELGTSLYMPTGQYRLLGIYLYDRTGNGANYWDIPPGNGASDGYYHFYPMNPFNSWQEKKTDVPLFHLNVVNERGGDVEGPEILAAEAVGEWKAGALATLRIKLRDKGSSVVNQAAVWLSPVKNDKTYRPGLLESVSVATEDDDWYRYQIRIPEFQRPGEYFLGQLIAHDLAQNFTTVNCYSEKYFPLEVCPNENGPALPVIKIRIDR